LLAFPTFQAGLLTTAGVRPDELADDSVGLLGLAASSLLRLVVFLKVAVDSGLEVLIEG
jgi:hypothetical protein